MLCRVFGILIPVLVSPCVVSVILSTDNVNTPDDSNIVQKHIVEK
jgi:hypothetical protein